MEVNFPTHYEEILQLIENIDPVKYGKTRNFIDGAVTRLSPYISRGVISTRQVLESVFQKGYKTYQIESFVKELCWRDYFQRVQQNTNINIDIKHPQYPVNHHETPEAIINATTGIDGIDTAIQQLYTTGYMHNHCRMYTAMVACNLAHSHWLNCAQWMYYYLLDGDWASNACSWQWVAGANSSKKYYANQENINRYTYTHQQATFLDTSYEAFADAPVPEPLRNSIKFVASTHLPETSVQHFNQQKPTFIYNYYNLDPLWHQQEEGNRILLLEPEVFKQYPVSEKCIKFMLLLGKNITGLQIFTGSFDDFEKEYTPSIVYYKEHPFNKGYKGIEESRDWISENVTGYFPSFFSYWKKIEKHLSK